MEPNRLTETYREGLSNGDIGFSLLMNKAILSKSSAACKTYGKIEALQQALDEYIIFTHEHYGPTRSFNFCLWLNEALHAFGAFVWYKGNSPNDTEYLFPDEAYAFMEQEIAWYKHESGSITDFIHIYTPLCAATNKLRIATRELESQYIEWWESSEIVKELRLNPNLAQYFIHQSRFLNRLSSYFFWLCQFHRVKGQLSVVDSSLPPQSVWSGAMPKFDNGEAYAS